MKTTSATGSEFALVKGVGNVPEKSKNWVNPTAKIHQMGLNRPLGRGGGTKGSKRHRQNESQLKSSGWVRGDTDKGDCARGPVSPERSVIRWKMRQKKKLKKSF